MRPRFPFGPVRKCEVVAIPLAALLAGGCSDTCEDPMGGGMPVPPVYSSAAQCGTCHPDQLAEWEMSMHAYAGLDPVMLALRDLAVSDGAMMADMCQICHTPAQVRLDRQPAGAPPAGLRIGTDMIEDGLSCDVCHSISKVPPMTGISYLMEVDPSGPKYADMVDPEPNGFHESGRRSFYGTSVVCASCHQVNLPRGGSLMNTFREWELSNLSGMGVECQTCHMPQYAGQAATGGPPRENLHRHKFVGVDYAYGPFRGIDLEQQKQDIRDLLQSAVTVTADVPASVTAGDSLALSVRVRNDLTGHSIPSGVTFNREMWIEVTVMDGLGAVIYQSGYLEINDDLVLPTEDPDLVRFGATMYDNLGQRTLFTWRAASVDDSDILPYLGSRTASYVVPIATGTTGPLTVDLALRFRPMPPGLLRFLGLNSLLPIPIFDMWTTAEVVPVTP